MISPPRPSPVPNPPAKSSPAAVAPTPGSAARGDCAVAPRPQFSGHARAHRTFHSRRNIGRAAPCGSTARVSVAIPTFRKRRLDPFVNAPITLHRAQRIPRRGRRDNQAVSPVGIMRHQTAARWPANQRPQQSPLRNVRILLKITERRRRLRPAIKTQHGPARSQRRLPTGRRPTPCCAPRRPRRTAADTRSCSASVVTIWAARCAGKVF